MKFLFAASLLALSTVSAAQSPPAPKHAPQSAQVDALAAFARVYGVVRYFHPSDSLDQVKWDRFLVHGAARMGDVGERKEIAPRLEELFAPIVENFRVAPAGAPTPAPKGEGPRVEWRHLGYGLEPDASSPYVSWRTHHPPLHGGSAKGGYFQHRVEGERSVHVEPVLRVPVAGGLEAHVPVSLPMSAAKVGDAQKQRLVALDASLEKVALARDPRNVTRAQAHADGIAVWNVARHFYPYWSALDLDWDARLREWLARQPATQSREALREALRRLIAPLEDGQGLVADPADREARAFLRVSIRPVGDQWVIDASQVDSVRPGDVIVAVDGNSAARYFGERLEVVHGTPQYRRWRAAYELMQGEHGKVVKMELARGTHRRGVTLAYDSPRPMQGPRPEPLSELAPGIRYVDASRFDRAAFEKALPQLARAKAVVFDVRGYPARDAVQLVQHWLPASEGAQWMFVPRYDRPGAQAGGAWSIGWQARASGALKDTAKVLVADARAVSYAESLAAYFPDQKVGPVVGEPTAGTNGNVVRANLPSGMTYFFTGMRVTRHDGSTPVHRVGIRPDVAVSPTIEGIRAGRDELIERAIAVAGESAKR